MTDTFHQRPQDVKAGRYPAYAGTPTHGDRSVRDEAINASPAAAHKVRLTLSVSGGSNVIAFTISKDGNSYAYSHAVGSGDTTATLAAVNVLAHLKTVQGGPFDFADIEINSAGTLDFISYETGTGGVFVLSGLTNCTQSTLTQGADAASIAFARAVVEVGFTRSSAFGPRQAAGLLDKFCALPSSTSLPAPVWTVTLGGTYTADENVVVAGSYLDEGVRKPIWILASGSLEADVKAAIIAKLNAAYGSVLTAASVSTHVVSVTSDVPGNDLQIEVYPLESGSTFTAAESVANDGTGLADNFLGVTVYDSGLDTDTFDTFATATKPGVGVKLVARGGVYVKYNAGTPSRTGLVYVGTASGEEGLFYAASGTGRVALPRSRARWGGYSGDIAVLNLY